MRYAIAVLLCWCAQQAIAQAPFPDFLQGTWKVQGKEVYEHWDKLNAQSMKGVAYAIKSGRVVVSEYLDIAQDGDMLVYTATAIGQNQGQGIAFALAASDTAYVFENPQHDFPKRIAYQQLSDSEIAVQVSDGGEKGFGYTMAKQVANDREAGLDNPNYAPELAALYGGDDYGMKSYWLVVLKTGSNTTATPELVAASFREHLDNINRLVEAGKLVVAGPLGKMRQATAGFSFSSA